MQNFSPMFIWYRTIHPDPNPIPIPIAIPVPILLIYFRIDSSLYIFNVKIFNATNAIDLFHDRKWRCIDAMHAQELQDFVCLKINSIFLFIPDVRRTQRIFCMGVAQKYTDIYCMVVQRRIYRWGEKPTQLARSLNEK